MRNKICQALIKELKGTKVTQELEWAMCLCKPQGLCGKHN